MTNEYDSPPFRIAVPGRVMREASSVADVGAWYLIGDCWAQLASSYLPQGPATVLDIGCSCAKVGRLLAYNPNVTFIGLDVFRPAIDWCRAAFAHNPKFRFHHIDVISSVYNPDGLVPPEHATFPVKDHSADLIIAGSLFTHLMEGGFQRYLSEVGRCLKPSGTALVSLHIVPDLDGIEGDGFIVNNIGRDYFKKLATDAGLCVSSDLGQVMGQTVYALTLLDESRRL